MEDVIHRYVKKPENVRQIGESSYSGQIYIEDYVMTYIRQIFKEDEEKIILMLGKKGEEFAKGSLFVYGAVGIDFKVTDAVTDISEKIWSEAYEKVYKYFPGAEVMGWVCGVYMWNSKVDATINIVHRKYFSKEDNILFLFDLSECEEKIFKWKDGSLKEQSGYYVYYEKNPQMQEFVLSENKTESVDEQYEDVVTDAIRETVNKNTKKETGVKPAFFVMTMAMAVMFVIGGNYMFESFAKINSLETAVDVLQGYVETGYKKDDKKNSTQSAIALESNTNKTSKQEKNSEIAGSDRDILKNGKKNTKSRGKEDRCKNRKVKIKVRKGQNTKKNGIKSSYQSYRVREGDTLSQIVWRQYHNLDRIYSVKQINNISDGNNIIAGQVIKLPMR